MNDDKKRLLFLISVKLLEIIFFVSLNYFIIEKKKKIVFIGKPLVKVFQIASAKELCTAFYTSST